MHRIFIPIFATILMACTSKTPPAQGNFAAVQVEKKPRFFGVLSPYRPDIQQGNFISREMVAQLSPGMTPEQVRYALGTPLVTDVFHGQRWDYPFRLHKGNGEITTSHITVFFENDRVTRITGAEDLPSETDYIGHIVGKKASGEKP